MKETILKVRSSVEEGYDFQRRVRYNHFTSLIRTESFSWEV